jgi:hypothetical protein
LISITLNIYTAFKNGSKFKSKVAPLLLKPQNIKAYWRKVLSSPQEYDCDLGRSGAGEVRPLYVYVQ